MRNKKKYSFQLQSSTPPITVSFLIYHLHSHIFADPTLTYSAWPPANGFHQMCSNLVLLTTFHSDNQLPGFSIQIHQNGNKHCQKCFLCLPRPFSLALLLCLGRATLLIVIPDFHFKTILQKCLCSFNIC